MKPVYVLVYLVVFLVLLGAVLVACGPSESVLVERETVVQTTVEVMAPAGTPEPTRERYYRSYPAPTHDGFPVISTKTSSSTLPTLTHFQMKWRPVETIYSTTSTSMQPSTPQIASTGLLKSCRHDTVTPTSTDGLIARISSPHSPRVNTRTASP